MSAVLFLSQRRGTVSTPRCALAAARHPTLEVGADRYRHGRGRSQPQARRKRHYQRDAAGDAVGLAPVPSGEPAKYRHSIGIALEGWRAKPPVSEPRQSYCC